ncbi:MAG: hypothetical protein AB7H71_17300 [Alphaproteobacteria bacterium]
MTSEAFAVVLLQNPPSDAVKPAQRKDFGRSFAADFLQKQQTGAVTGKNGRGRPGILTAAAAADRGNGVFAAPGFPTILRIPRRVGEKSR